MKDRTFSKWEKIIEKGQEVTIMVFEHGQACWNGPERSLKVLLECGESNEIYSVAEPSKCEYVMKMKTPAQCPAPRMKDEL
jgi:protein kinase C substrate 80K-H